MKKLMISACLSVGLLAFGPAGKANAQGGDEYAGQMIFTGANFCPRGWARTDGQLLAVSSNDALFSLLGTIYGGDGRTTFGLPDLRGRAIMHTGTGPGLSPRRIGAKGGAEQMTLTTNNLPPHNHTPDLMATTSGASTSAPAGAALASAANIYAGRAAMDSPMPDTAVTVAATGGSRSFGIMQPSQGILTCIALYGIYPSRN